MNGFIKLIADNQISTVGGMAGGYLFNLAGPAGGYSASQIDGALVCILSVALQVGLNLYSRSKKPAAPAAQPPAPPAA